MKTPADIRFFALLLIAVNIAYAVFPGAEEQGGIYQTKHNLLSGMILPADAEKKELCVWCHIPHDSLSGDMPSPKWLTRSDNEENFIVYGMEENATVPAHAKGPDVMVRVCLTCHDGVNAPNISLFSEEAPQRFNMNTASTGTSGQQEGALVHSHPVGVNYTPTSPGGAKAGLRPTTYTLRGWSGAKTIHDVVSEGTIRCTSCHDPHSTNALFLRTKNTGSKLCKGCHNK